MIVDSCVDTDDMCDPATLTFCRRHPRQARRLLSTLTAPISSGLARLVALLERVEDLKHVLLWGTRRLLIRTGAGCVVGSAPLSLRRSRKLSNPVIRLAPRLHTSDVQPTLPLPTTGPHESAGGSDNDLPLELVELPRLQLTFEARRAADGKVRLHSVEHPGLHVGWLPGDRLKTLLRGMPHALVLLNDEVRASSVTSVTSVTHETS